MHIMSVLCSFTETVSSANYFTVFKILTINVAMLSMFMLVRNFTFGFGFVLSSEADFSNTSARPSNSKKKNLIYPRVRPCSFKIWFELVMVIFRLQLFLQQTPAFWIISCSFLTELFDLPYLTFPMILPMALR